MHLTVPQTLYRYGYDAGVHEEHRQIARGGLLNAKITPGLMHGPSASLERGDHICAASVSEPEPCKWRGSGSLTLTVRINDQHSDDSQSLLRVSAFG